MRTKFNLNKGNFRNDILYHRQDNLQTIYSINSKLEPLMHCARVGILRERERGL
jgi:hypothetical protein